MTSYTRFVPFLATGLVASVGLAEPADVMGPLDSGRSPTASNSWLVYISGAVGPSNVAPIAADSPARIEHDLNMRLAMTLAGPSNIVAGSRAALNIDLGDFGDGPGSGANEFRPAGPAPDLLASLQTAERPDVVTHRATPITDTDPGFQVVVPLPSAGLLTAGGLAFVAVRRRR